MTNVSIDINNFQIRIFFDGATPTVRLILQGHKAINILKEVSFKDGKKEFLRKLIIEQYGKYGAELFRSQVWKGTEEDSGRY